MTTKVCNKCGVNQPLENFCKASGGKYRRSECRSCERELNKVRNELKKTAPTVPVNHICPICQRSELEVKGRGGKKSGTWCCDHDHNTNKFRGWLCHQCNRALGGMNDDLDRLERAMKYLKETNDTLV
jgi:hypothetical protein